MQAPGFQQNMVDVVTLVLLSTAGPDAAGCVAAAGDGRRMQVGPCMLAMPSAVFGLLTSGFLPSLCQGQHAKGKWSECRSS